MLLAIGLAATPSHAQNASATAETEILGSFSVIEVDELDFGTIIPGTTGGSVDIDKNNGNCSTNGGITLVGNSCHRGHFLILGDPNTKVQITTDSAPITLNRQGGGATMEMDKLRVSGGKNQTLNGAGRLTFYASGRLQVGANQAPGVYDATFNVTVEYR
ncbi:MAG: DUF4402 domain-containing protein [Sphingomonadaceae bacterium]|nr:DUF4402 domain-containing protein [Sphingomonadaceae bacterium]